MAIKNPPHPLLTSPFGSQGVIVTLTLPSPLPSPERLAFAEALAQAGCAQAGIEGEREFGGIS